MRSVTPLLLSIAGVLSVVLLALPRNAGPVATAMETAGVAVGEGVVAPATETPSAAAIDRARREVRMLDDLYKTSVVLITTHYVKDEDSLSAASAARALFAAMKEKGWHEVRLMDATGQPYLDENLPQEGFEKRAISQLLEGKASYDEVVTEDGKSWLLAATPVPVVMEKCIICHENYRDVEKNRPVGALSYRVPVLE